MARLARVVCADVAQHVTQRGNGRQFLLASEAEREVYLDLLRRAVRQESLAVLGYCLMSNHVHLVVAPHRPWAWSSAAAHCGQAEPDVCLEMETWRRRWSPERWQEFLAQRESEGVLTELRRSTYSGARGEHRSSCRDLSSRRSVV